MLNKLGGLLRETSLILGITILLMCVLEVAFSLFYLVKDRVASSDLPIADYHVSADTYPHQPWVNEYWDDFQRCEGAEWRPYVYWRRKACDGKHITIGSNGLRQTIESGQGQATSTKPVTIFMFGGSTMWGTGARDAYTIPSLLTQHLQSKGVVAKITNFGESGYVSTQEVIGLIRLLQVGNIPDLVIFYDGINDTFSAYQQHTAGVPQNEFNRVREFNLSSPDKTRERRALVLRDISANLSTMRFLRGLYWRFRVPDTGEAATNPFLVAENSPIDSDSLVQDLIQSYSGNIELVKALSEHYGFRYIFYWQPTILGKPELTGYENGQLKAMKQWEPFFRKTYAAVEKDGLAWTNLYNFRNIGAAFSTVREPVFVDWSHLGETGNDTIARVMTNDVLGSITAGGRVSQ